MKSEYRMRKSAYYRLNLVDMFRNDSIYLARKVEKKENGEFYTYYIVKSEEECNAYKIGNVIIDCHSQTNYRIFRQAELVEKRGKKIYKAKLEDEILPEKLGRKMIRIYQSVDNKNFKSSVLRYYEITYIINTLRKHREVDNDLFWKWIKSSDRSLQINHITGEMANSGNFQVLEICTMTENLVHSFVLRQFRKKDKGVGAVFLATAKECLEAKKEYLEETGSEKADYEQIYKKLVENNKVVYAF